jgi:2-polyprenyl-3-methyl-5-hydroxy-6-metoxy-1,4-benzoquinol methylase
VNSTRYYDEGSELLASQYNAKDPESVHQSWKALLDKRSGGLACDIGAGSGRDARWLAAKGWEVVAVEPSEAMRVRGEAYTRGQTVSWISDALPELKHLAGNRSRFDLILLSAVWQHLPPNQRSAALDALSNLLKPGGHLVITLRQGSDEAENRARQFYPVSVAELEDLAHENALRDAGGGEQADPERPHICWQTRVFKRPETDHSSACSPR